MQITWRSHARSPPIMGLPIQWFGLILIFCVSTFTISGFFTSSPWRIVWFVGSFFGLLGVCNLLRWFRSRPQHLPFNQKDH